MGQNAVLIVDDEETNRAILCELFKHEFRILEAQNGIEALELLEAEKKSIVIILLDIFMPQMGGFEFLEVMKNKNLMDHIPVILITGDESLEAEKRGYEMGVADIVRKPFEVNLVRRRVQNVINLYLHKNHLEYLVEKQTEELRRQAKKLKETNNFVIDTLSTVVEFRNLESGMHIQRIRNFTKILAECVAKQFKEYHLTSDKVDVISSASAMHDVGKIAIPDTILLKPGKLTKEEFEVMKCHTTKGCEIINSVSRIQDEEYFKYCYDIARYHHERYDGRGYPDGLKGEEIPIHSQIVSLADVYDALISDRVYKSAFSKEEAYQMILRGECGTFSPKLITCLSMVKEEFENMADAQ